MAMVCVNHNCCSVAGGCPARVSSLPLFPQECLRMSWFCLDHTPSKLRKPDSALFKLTSWSFFTGICYRLVKQRKQLIPFLCWALSPTRAKPEKGGRAFTTLSLLSEHCSSCLPSIVSHPPLPGPGFADCAI